MALNWSPKGGARQGWSRGRELQAVSPAIVSVPLPACTSCDCCANPHSADS